jgi:hypothetical protein
MQYSTGGEITLSKVKSVVVVTPTIGKPEVVYAIKSVQEQKTSVKVEHLLIVDGPEYLDEFRNKFSDFDWTNDMQFMMLPWNVGANGFYGHRVYAAISHLINADAVMFLDEDNCYGTSHVETCVAKLNEGYDFVFSHRYIIDQNNVVICRDRFEAIGKPPLNLVDTSSYCFRTKFLTTVGHVWHWGWGADRRFFQLVSSHNFKYASTEKPTLYYRLDGNPNSPKKEFFFEGNRQAGYKENGDLING